jgi:hypothetical protein
MNARTSILPAWISVARRYGAVLLLLALGLIAFFPTLVVLPPDAEGLWTEIETTAFQARYLFHEYPFWDPWIGFGVPHPLGETLTFHPFLLLIRAVPLGVALPILYLAQIWIALLAVWAVCRQLALRPWISLLCAVTYLLSPVTIVYLHNFWPSPFVAWTLAPLLLLLLLKLLDSERTSSRVFYGVSTGLCAALMFLDGHPGVFPVFVVAFVAFLVGRFTALRPTWLWLGVALLVVTLAGATRVYDLALETTGVSSRHQQFYAMNFPALLLYPISASEHYRLLAIGGPFMVLAAIGLVYRRVSQRHLNGFRAAALVSFVSWFFLASVIFSLSGNWYTREPFTLFAVFLAGSTLQVLWDEFPHYRLVLGAAAGLQVLVLVAGFSTYYRRDFTRAVDYMRGRATPTLQTVFENQPLYSYFEKRPDRRSTRVYMAPRAENRLWGLNDNLWHKTGTSADYEFAGWSLHGLRLVNARFKGVNLKEFTGRKQTIDVDFRADPTFARSDPALDVLDVGYVLAFPDETVSPSLVLLHRFRLADSTVIEAYHNPRHWPDAVPLDVSAKQIDSLRARRGCTNPGLLCADFSKVEAIGHPEAVVAEKWHGTSLDVRLATSPQASVLMLSQLYRPGWKAHLSNGTTVRGYRLFGGVTGFDLPPGVDSLEIVFQPTARIVVAAVSWATILLSLVLIAAASIRARRVGGS